VSTALPYAGRRVAVFGLGGTIAMAANTGGGVVPSLSAEQLVAAVSGLDRTGIRVETVDFRRSPGASLSPADITELAAAIDARFADDVAGRVDGVVVTQGTDTIEETAYLLDLLHASPRPVVVTGGMRNPTLAGADGPANVLAAIQVAATPQSCGQGVLVVLADEIHAARRVRKSHSTSVATFQSPNGGAQGYVVEGIPQFLTRLEHRMVVPLRSVSQWPTVGLHTVAFGDDGGLLPIIGGQVAGLVIAGFGVGHVPAPLAPVLGDLADRIPVVLASRTGAGSVLRSTYAFPGSEADLRERGLIPAGFLDAYKARLLLQALLAAGADRQAVIAAFGAAGGYADPDSWPYRLA
jgi:L-asparaginase